MAMRITLVVDSNKYFEDLTVETIFLNIISKLVPLCLTEKQGSNETSSCTEPQAKKKKKFKEDPDFFNYRRDQIVATIRATLDHYLVMNGCSEIRQKLIEHFILSHDNLNDQIGWLSGVYHNLCMLFYNIVLNESFTSCSLTGGKGHPFHLLDPAQLLQVISEHSPSVQCLNLSFGSPAAVLTFNPTFAHMFQCFHCLTSLTLSLNISDNNCLSFFTSLGYSCPNLTNLQLDNFLFGSHQLLALILGPRRQLLPQHLLDEMHRMLAQLEFTLESLTPICSSLKQLKHSHDSKFEARKCHIWDFSTVFALRHLRNLEVLEHSCIKHSKRNPLVKAVLFWHRQQQSAVDWSSKQMTSIDLVTDDCIQWTLSSNFTGHLNLVKLSGIGILRSREMMQAITTLCPHLKELHFLGESNLMETDDEILTIEELKTFLSSTAITSCWSKLEVVNIKCISAAYRHVLLNHIGKKQLRQLFLFDCQEIDPFSELLSCVRLEFLYVSPDCTMAPFPSDAGTNADALVDYFLPVLEKMTSSICLGDWSRLFECQRPSLTMLTLACSHIGLSWMNQFSWNDVSSLWPKLQELRLYDTKGLDFLTVCPRILPQFRDLKRLTLSCEMPSTSDSGSTMNLFIKVAIHSALLTGNIQFRPQHKTKCPFYNHLPHYYNTHFA